MQPIWGNVAALAVALIFYVWRTHTQLQQRRQRRLRERVAYMLWHMAERMDIHEHSLSVKSFRVDGRRFVT